MFKTNNSILDVPFKKFLGLRSLTGRVTMSAWGFNDIAYYSIVHANDFNTWTPNNYEIIDIYNDYLTYDNVHSKKELEEIDSEELILKFSFGFSQKQFWYQELFRFREEFNRQVELLEVIAKKKNDFLDLDAILIEKTGFDIKSFRTVLFGLFALASKNSEIKTPLLNGSASKINQLLTMHNIYKVIELYTCDYSQVRNSSLRENYFYIKPIIRTVSNRLIVVNLYMLAKKMADGPFWVLRDYFLENQSQDFVNAFGDFFEEYVNKLFSYYLSSHSFERIPPPNEGKYADWFVYTNNYRLIIELKSSVAALMLHSLYPNMAQLHKYLDKFAEGVIQLDSTIKSYPEDEKQSIKILVHYERLYFSDGELRPVVVNKVRNSISDTNNIFFCNIYELEWLMGVLSESEETFDIIINEKIKTQENPKIGIDFEQIIPRHTDNGNNYIFNAINHWKNYFDIKQ